MKRFEIHKLRYDLIRNTGYKMQCALRSAHASHRYSIVMMQQSVPIDQFGLVTDLWQQFSTIKFGKYSFSEYETETK